MRELVTSNKRSCRTRDSQTGRQQQRVVSVERIVWGLVHLCMKSSGFLVHLSLQSITASQSKPCMFASMLC